MSYTLPKLGFAYLNFFAHRSIEYGTINKLNIPHIPLIANAFSDKNDADNNREKIRLFLCFCIFDNDREKNQIVFVLPQGW